LLDMRFCKYLKYSAMFTYQIYYLFQWLCAQAALFDAQQLAQHLLILL
jgi:hypothetical protein